MSEQTLVCVGCVKADPGLCRLCRYKLGLSPRSYCFVCVGCVRTDPGLCGLCHNRPWFVWAVSTRTRLAPALSLLRVDCVRTDLVWAVLEQTLVCVSCVRTDLVWAVSEQILVCAGCVRADPVLCGLCQNRPWFVRAVSTRTRLALALSLLCQPARAVSELRGE